VILQFKVEMKHTLVPGHTGEITITEILLKVALNTINPNPLDNESGTISCSAGLY
jgi:hypothetical protein